MGPVTLSEPNNIEFYYVYGPDALIGQNGTGTYLIRSTLTLDVYIPAINEHVQLNNGMLEKTNRFWEGVWKGTTVFPDDSWCLTTGNFKGNFWRGFQTQCSSDAGMSFATTLGTFSATEASISFTYGFVDIDGKGGNGLQGQTLTYDVKTNMVGSQPQVTLTSSTDQATIRLLRL